MNKTILALVVIAIGLLVPVLGQLAFGVNYLFIAPISFVLMMYALYKFVLVQNSTSVAK
jgi:hypothetical protein